MGINNDDIYILESGQWSMDPEWSSMAKNPYEAPQYLIGMGTLKTGEAVQTMTKSQLTTAMTGEIKICNVLDVRVKADYDAGHIDGAVSASVKENDGSALKEEVQKAGKDLCIRTCRRWTRRRRSRSISENAWLRSSN